MYICLCKGVTESDVRETVRQGAGDFTEVVERSGAGSGCGGCHGTLLTLLHEWGISTAGAPVGADAPSCAHVTCPRLLGVEVTDCASQTASQN